MHEFLLSVLINWIVQMLDWPFSLQPESCIITSQPHMKWLVLMFSVSVCSLVHLLVQDTKEQRQHRRNDVRLTERGNISYSWCQQSS